MSNHESNHSMFERFILSGQAGEALALLKIVRERDGKEAKKIVADLHPVASAMFHRETNDKYKEVDHA